MIAPGYGIGCSPEQKPATAAPTGQREGSTLFPPACDHRLQLMLACCILIITSLQPTLKLIIINIVSTNIFFLTS